MPWTLILALIVVGLLFLILEILVVPGTTVVGIAGFAMLVFGIYETYALYGTTAGHLVLAGTVVATVLVLYFSLKSRTWKRMMLSKNIDGKVNVVDEQSIHTGDIGQSISRLAPAGKALINGVITEVHSMEGFLDENVDIEVVRIDHSRIIVKRKNN